MKRERTLADTGFNRIEQHEVLGRLPDDTPVTIVVDGRTFSARSDDTVASALLAHGIRVFRSMPDSEKPRGYFCGIGRCPDCIVTVDGQLNIVACAMVVHDGMKIETQRGLGTWTVS